VFWPEEKFRRTPPLDVILDRAAAADVESVMVAGRLVLDEGRFTTVDEDAVRRTIDDAADRLLGPAGVDPGAVSLGREVEPYVFDFYRPWTARPVTPAAVYNAATPPTTAASSTS
jgi:5-methylthioadenosine/S-adenosylhomocysteine deaminase